MSDWSDEQINAARTCFVLAWRGPDRPLRIADIPERDRLEAESDPVKLLQTQRFRSREELTSEHLRSIAVLTTRSDLEVANDRHRLDSQDDVLVAWQPLIPKYIGAFRSLVQSAWDRRTRFDLVDSPRERIVAEIASDLVLDAIRTRDWLWQLAGELAVAAYEFTNDFLDDEPEPVTQSDPGGSGSLDGRRRRLRLITDSPD
ncbi:hypothetical protein BKG86_21340 [Mycobacteroides chelonae]|uniref:hypothetical protein n=1 Tax=Mycobacteroides chelonae TaxID=1774 RepID=UPI0008A97125|nr:hypothetical protein [Mycobacteroides chelonae]OHU66444.1 hypothetical protein BKG86_21340 [Mycobacteroides chelonae]